MLRHLVVDGRFPLPARRLESLVQQLLKVSRQEAVRVIHDGGVAVNGRSVRKPVQILEPGDRVQVDYEPPVAPAPRVPLRQEKLLVVFEDEHLVVVEKPAALLTVPTPYREKVTLISLLEKRLQAKAGSDQRAYCVHRLDRGVSGLLVFARQLALAEALREQFAARKPERLYAAIVAGVLKQAQGTFRSHLATDEELNRYSTNDDSGELAITHYQTLQSLEGATLVQVQLETGRRNQIRVHFAEAGHPVLGDPRYGRHAQTPILWNHRRLALHAQTLGFEHPVTGQQLKFASELPAEMQRYVEQAASTRRRGRRQARD